MKLTKEQRQRLYKMFNGRCAYCGELLGERWHADHVKHIGRPGNSTRKGLDWPERDRFENLMPSCPPCNIDKHAMTLEDWRGKLQRSCEILRANKPTYRHALRFGLVKETGAKIVFHFERVASRKRNT